MRAAAVLTYAFALCAVAFGPPARAQAPPLIGWERVGPDSTSADALAFDPWTGPARLWIAGFHYMSSGGGTIGGLHGLWASDGSPEGPWAYTPTGEYGYGVDNAHALLFLGPDTLLTAGQLIRRSTDAGATFDPVFLPTDGYGVTLAEAPPESPYAGALYGGITVLSVSADRGATWAQTTLPNGADGEAGVHALRSGRLLLFGRTGCTVSDDGGATVAPCPGLYRPDAGIWLDESVLLPRGGPGSGERVLAQGYEAGRGEPVWATDDGGETWDEVAHPPTTDDFIAAVALPLAGPRSAVLVGLYGEVWQTDDGGGTWALRAVSPAIGPPPGDPDGPNTFVKSAAVGPDGRLYIGHVTQGAVQRGGVWRTTAPLGLVPGPTGSAPGAPSDSDVSLTVAPNPSGGASSVTVTLGGRSDSARVSVYDALGREVAVVHDGPLAEGPHWLAVETARLAPGVYVVRLAAGRATQVRTFTVVR